MDQNSTGGTDKRNWRERLGIGTKDNVVASKDLPKVAGEFRGTIVPQAPSAVVSAPKTVAAAVRPAPMAPRPAPRPAAATTVVPVQPRPAAPPVPRAAPTSPDALANKLKAQRDAAEKLAEQRVAAAKQRAEAAMPSQVNGGGEKPKFTFADDEPKSSGRSAATQPATRSAPQAQRMVPPNQLPQNGYSNQIAPPRPPLGGGQAVPARAAPPPPQSAPQPAYPNAPAYPTGQPYFPPQAPQYPTGYQQPPQGYAPVPPPAYRPIDPATGYAPPSQFNPQLRQPFPPASGPNPPRLQVPQQRSSAAGFNSPTSAFGSDVQRNLRPNLSPPLRSTASTPVIQGDEDDIFEQPAPRPTRRATADEYSQAYREVETGYEDEQPRSYTPLILLSLIGLAVVAGLLGWWGYNNYIKNGGKFTSSQTEVPVVAAPAKPAKAAPDVTATDNAAAGKAANTSKKLIYDRIVGDREVTGGQMVPSEETPVQPLNNAAPADPAAPVVVNPAEAPPAPTAGTGSDGTPLPLPPPPGGAAAPQGALDPAGKNDVVKTAETIIMPAAGAQSTAAVASPVVPGTQLSTQTTGVDTAAGSAPVGSEVITPKVEASKPTAITPAKKIAAEVINDTLPEPKATATEKKLSLKPKKVASSEKSLGSNPVVLVPPSKFAQQKNSVVPTKKIGSKSSGGSGLYGNSEVGQGSQIADADIAPIEVPQKRKTLLDLFKTDSAASTSSVTAPVAEAPAITARPSPTQQVAAVAPKIVEPAQPKPTGAFVAQLASFKSKSEANAEYSRLVAKHGEIIKRYAPIIEQANVAGGTRYRLNIGPMATSNVATNLCSSLFAAGERDCLVHRQ
jgi:SPOR domain